MIYELKYPCAKKKMIGTHGNHFHEKSISENHEFHTSFSKEKVRSLTVVIKGQSQGLLMLCSDKNNVIMKITVNFSDLTLQHKHH